MLLLFLLPFYQYSRDLLSLSCTLELYTLWSCNQLNAHNSRMAALQTPINIALLGKGILIYPCCKDTALLLSCAVWMGFTISLCYYWLAAGGSGQEISTDMDSDPLEQPTSTGAVRLSAFYKFPPHHFKYGERPIQKRPKACLGFSLPFRLFELCSGIKSDSTAW